MTKQDKIAVFDVLGPCYHYDTNGWVTEKGAIGPLTDRLKQHGYQGKTLEEEARDEEDLVFSGKETPIIMPGFAESCLYLREQGVKPVVVSAGTDKILEYAVEKAAQDYSQRTGQEVHASDLVERKDLVSTISIGSKKKPETWAEAVRKYDNKEVVAIWEDTWANLDAAVTGLQAQRGYHVTSSASGLSVVEQDRKIYRGQMNECLDHLTKDLSF